MATVADVMKIVKDNEVKFVDLRFTDTRGKEQHVSVPLSAFGEHKFSDGHYFDGSSIAGWKSIEASDMVLLPDPDTARMDPFTDEPTLLLTCDVIEPSDGKGYDRDPRSIAKRGEAYLKSTGIADTAFFGPEPEFFIFDSVTWKIEMGQAFYKIKSEEAPWSSGEEFEGGNMGHRAPIKGGYFPVPPVDSLQDIRSAMVLALQEMGVECEVHHHEVATAGQAEIDIRYDTLTRQADNIMKFKYVVANVAHQAGKVVTFMPKPLFGDNGSGMHTHQSIWNDSANVFHDTSDRYAQLSMTARHYIGGLFKHAAALMAFCAPTTNSYKRLVPGYEAPVNLVYSKSNRSAAVRIPMYSSSPVAKRIEFRSPDPLCNPYLAFSAMLMAGIDGVQNKIDPGEPLDEDTYHLSAEKAAKIASVPKALDVSLDALENDHAFLTKGGVFNEDFIQTWIELKRQEADQVRLRPHPWEFALYFDH